jgi:hypothetical protein
LGSLGFYNNSPFNSIYSSTLAFKVAYTKRLILALVIVLVAGISGLVYISVVGLGGFYIGAFRQKLAVKI